MSQTHRTQTVKQEADIFEYLVSQIGSLGEAADSQLCSQSISLAATLVTAKNVTNLAKSNSQPYILSGYKRRACPFVRRVAIALGNILHRLAKDLQRYSESGKRGLNEEI